MHTSRTPKNQQGWTIVRKTYDDLRLLVNELTSEELVSEDSGRKVYNKIKEVYSEFLGVEKQYAGLFKTLLYEKSSRRRGDENMVSYSSRK